MRANTRSNGIVGGNGIVGVGIASAAAALAMLVSMAALGQNAKFTVPREKVLSIAFKEQPQTPALKAGPSYAASSGNVWEKEVAHPSSVRALRVHVQVESEGGSNWHLRVLDAASGAEIERIERSSPLVKAKQFWTTTVPSSRAKIELWAEGDPNGIELAIDRYAFATSPTKPQGTIPPDREDPDRQCAGVCPSFRQIGCPARDHDPTRGSLLQRLSLERFSSHDQRALRKG